MCRERIANLVREHCDELVHPPGRVLQVLDMAPSRKILRHLREAAQYAVRIAERRDDNPRPEALPVLAQAPPLLFHAPLLARKLQLGPRLSFGDVVGRIEVREVPPMISAGA